MSVHYYLLVTDNIMLFPKVGRAIVGLTTSFVCNTTEKTRWYYSRGPTIPENSRPILQNSKRLIIKDVNLTSAGYYFCFGKYSKGSKNFLAMAELQVFGTLTIMLYVLIVSVT